MDIETVHENNIERRGMIMSEKTFAVRYYTRTGNTKKLAQEIGHVVGCKAESIEMGLEENVDILFLGCSVYAGGVSSEVKNYIKNMNNNNPKKVVIFSTSALAERAFLQVSKLLKEKGIIVSENNFYCRGEFKFIHKGKPDAADLKAAAAFAKKIMED